jgi:hypothetical protein
VSCCAWESCYLPILTRTVVVQADALYDSGRIATDKRTCRDVSVDDSSRCNDHIVPDGDTEIPMIIPYLVPRRYATDLTDAEWALIKPVIDIPQTGRGRRRKVNLRAVTNALLYKL